MPWNYCPNCGHRTDQHNNPAPGRTGGCTHQTQTHHIIRVTDREQRNWTLKHPLQERENDKLFDCKTHADLQHTTLPQPGDWAIIENPADGWTYEPPNQAHQPCNCDITLHTLNNSRTV
jgi:Family of unknown function (DUF6085)